MKNRIVASALAISLSVFGAQAMFASPLAALHTPVMAKMGKTKMVTVKLQNSSQSALTLQAGDQKIVLAPGSMNAVKVAVGTQITNVDASGKYAAGDVVATVNSEMNGNMLTFN